MKQKFVALLKRFRVPEELEPGVTRNSGALEGDREIDELFKVAFFIFYYLVLLFFL